MGGPPCPVCGGPYPRLWIRNTETREIIGCTHDVEMVLADIHREIDEAEERATHAVVRALAARGIVVDTPMTEAQP